MRGMRGWSAVRGAWRGGAARPDQGGEGVLVATVRTVGLPALISCAYGYISLSFSLSPFQSQEEKQTPEPQDPQHGGQL